MWSRAVPALFGGVWATHLIIIHTVSSLSSRMFIARQHVLSRDADIGRGLGLPCFWVVYKLRRDPDCRELLQDLQHRQWRFLETREELEDCGHVLIVLTASERCFSEVAFQNSNMSPCPRNHVAATCALCVVCCRVHAPGRLLRDKDVRGDTQNKQKHLRIF